MNTAFQQRLIALREEVVALVVRNNLLQKPNTITAIEIRNVFNLVLNDLVLNDVAGGDPERRVVDGITIIGPET